MAGIFAWMRGSGGVTYAWAAGTLYGISRPDRSERRNCWQTTRPTWIAPHCRYPVTELPGCTAGTEGLRVRVPPGRPSRPVAQLVEQGKALASAGAFPSFSPAAPSVLSVPLLPVDCRRALRTWTRLPAGGCLRVAAHDERRACGTVPLSACWPWDLLNEDAVRVYQQFRFLDQFPRAASRGLRPASHGVNRGGRGTPRQRVAGSEVDAGLLDRGREGGDDRPGLMRVVRRG